METTTYKNFKEAKKMKTKIKVKLFALLVALPVLLGLVLACGKNAKNDAAREGDYKYLKESGGDDFLYGGNLVGSGLNIDGVPDEDDWGGAITLDYGNAGHVEAKILWGDAGIIFGLTLKDEFLRAAYYPDPSDFILKNDNIEIYIDTQNNGDNDTSGGNAKCQSDDYWFTIVPSGHILIQGGGGSGWGAVVVVVDYAVAVQGTLNDDSDTDEGWTLELFVPYATFGFEKTSTIGITFGSRIRENNTENSLWFGWVGDPHAPSTYVNLNKDGYFLNSVEGYKTVAGEFAESEGGGYESVTGDSMMIKTDETGAFAVMSAYGSLETRLTANTRGDNGIVFGLRSTSNLFWESGAEYYFALINSDGLVMLARVTGYDGTVWTTVADAMLADYNTGTEYTLRAEYDGDGYVGVFVDGAAKISYIDPSPLTGTAYGLRAQKGGVEFGPVTTGALTAPGTVNNGAYTQANGSWSFTGGKYVSGSNSSIAVRGDVNAGWQKHESGSLETGLKANAGSDNGIVFGLSDVTAPFFWESGASYYFAVINVNGDVLLGRINHITIGWTTVAFGGRIEGAETYDPTVVYTLRVEYDAGGNIAVFVNNVSYILYKAEAPLPGGRYGVRAASAGVEFSGVTAGALTSAGETLFEMLDDGMRMGHRVGFKDDSGCYYTPRKDTIMYKNMGQSDGVLTTTVNLGGALGVENSILFALTPPSNSADARTNFWSGTGGGLSYYVLIFNENATTILKRSTSSGETDVAISTALEYDPRPTNTVLNVRIEKSGRRINVWIDDQLLIACMDTVTLDGVHAGFRTGNNAAPEAARFGEFTAAPLTGDEEWAEAGNGMTVTKSIIYKAGNDYAARAAALGYVDESTGFTDGVIEFDYRAYKRADNAVIFRGSDFDTGPDVGLEQYKGYMFMINMWGSLFLAPINKAWPGPGSIPVDIGQNVWAAGSYDPAKTYHVKIEVAGYNIKVYINEVGAEPPTVPAINWTDPASTYASGVIGFRFGGPANFLNLTVTSN
jgi:hypothetical protein